MKKKQKETFIGLIEELDKDNELTKYLPGSLGEIFSLIGEVLVETGEKLSPGFIRKHFREQGKKAKTGKVIAHLPKGRVLVAKL